MSNRTSLFVTQIFIVFCITILCVTTWFCVANLNQPSFSQICKTREYQSMKRENAQVWKLLKRGTSDAKRWRDIIESNDKELAVALEDLQLVEYALRTKAAQAPFQFAQGSTQDAQNIEFTIDGQLVYLVGPGAQAALEKLQ